MIDKISGEARYAVVNFCGFMCLRPGHHPLPWNSLKYDKELERLRDQRYPAATRDCPRVQRC